VKKRKDQAKGNYQCVMVVDWQRKATNVVCTLRIREATSLSLEKGGVFIPDRDGGVSADRYGSQLIGLNFLLHNRLG